MKKLKLSNKEKNHNHAQEGGREEFQQLKLQSIMMIQ